MNFFRYLKIYFIISALLVGAAIMSIAVFRLPIGIDFTTGSILEVDYAQGRPSNQEIQDQLSNIDLGSVTIQPVGESGVLLKMKDISPETHQEILKRLGDDAKELRFESIGPIVGRELRNKTFLIVLLSVSLMLLYIAIAFRRVTKPISSWHYSLASIVPLIVNILVPVGVFAVLGQLGQSVQITVPVVVALLTVFGYTINDTVVVFDRVRENILTHAGLDFIDVVNRSFRQTLARNLGTSFTVLLTLFAIFFFGGGTLKDFSLALIIGIATGLFSSLFLAPSFLIFFAKVRHS
ncbi:MAG: protein translocase subunit SecF [Candidatus Wildermuthbacteria bacterium]|nr:protein translocase subunit SecF [Candidatus Wildermuthbacteria bacterium]